MEEMNVDLKLRRVDYARDSVERIALLSVLILGEKDSLNKAVLVDYGNILEIGGISKEQINPQVKVNLKESCVSIVTAGKTEKEKNRIFLATDSGKILGYSHKGKKSFEMETDFTEPIKSFAVEETDIYLISDYTYRRMHRGNQLDFYLSPEKLITIITSKTSLEDVLVVIACADKTLKTIKESEVELVVDLQQTASCLALFNAGDGNEGDLIMYGCVDGSFGLCQINRKEPRVIWHTKSPKNHYASVSCILFYNMTSNCAKFIDDREVGDGVKNNLDIIIGFDDGWVEVYQHVGMQKPYLIFSTCINDGVKSLQVGRFSDADCIEILCLTLSGWLVGLTSEPLNPDHPREQTLKKIINHISNQAEIQAAQQRQDLLQIQDLKSEIKQLEKQLSKAKMKYEEKNQKLTRSSVGFSVKENLQFLPHLFCYSLSLQCSTAIDFVLLQTTALFEITDMATDQAINSSTPCNDQDENKMLMTFRCHANVNRLEIKLVPKEGSHGSLNVFVVARQQPPTCVQKSFHLTPLSMHVRHYDRREKSEYVNNSNNNNNNSEKFDYEDDSDLEFAGIHNDDNDNMNDNNANTNKNEGENKKTKNLWNFLKLEGGFALNVIHSWLLYCFWDFPEKPPSNGAAKLTFRSVYMNTLVRCKYRQGEVQIHAHNLSTLDILKDVLTKLATKSGFKLDICTDINDESVLEVVKGLAPRLEGMVVLAKKLQLIEALKPGKRTHLLVVPGVHSNRSVEEEMDSNGGCVLGQFQDLLRQSDALMLQKQQQIVPMETYFGLIVGLYARWVRWIGGSCKNSLPLLEELVVEKDVNKIVKFFAETL